MIFANPGAFYLFSLIVPVVVLFYFSENRRQKKLKAFASQELLRQLIATDNGRQRRAKAWVVILAMFFQIVALMRPQAGLVEEQTTTSGLDIMIAIDTSKSMLAEDIRPNRLEQARAVARDLASRLRGDRVGLIAFAGGAFLLCPLTMDYNGFLQALDALDINSIPKQGSSLASAINETVKGLQGGGRKAGVLLIITDGEDHEGELAEAVSLAKQDGVAIFTVGAGTPEGELIPVTDENGGRFFLKDRQGNVVKSRLDEVRLQELSTNTGGRYARITELPAGIDYDHWFSGIQRIEARGWARQQHRDVFQFPLALALLLLVWECLISGSRQDAKAPR